jgi:hypothetical protein
VICQIRWCSLLTAGGVCQDICTFSPHVSPIIANTSPSHEHRGCRPTITTPSPRRHLLLESTSLVRSRRYRTPHRHRIQSQCHIDILRRYFILHSRISLTTSSRLAPSTMHTLFSENILSPPPTPAPVRANNPFEWTFQSSNLVPPSTPLASSFGSSSSQNDLLTQFYQNSQPSISGETAYDVSATRHAQSRRKGNPKLVFMGTRRYAMSFWLDKCSCANCLQKREIFDTEGHLREVLARRDSISRTHQQD